MPLDWILLALVVLLLLLALWTAFRRSDHRPLQTLRADIQADVQQFERGLRDEVARSAGGTRTELAQKLGTFQGIPGIVDALGGFCTSDRAGQVRAFFDKNPVPTSARSLQQGDSGNRDWTNAREWSQSPDFCRAPSGLILAKWS